MACYGLPVTCLDGWAGRPVSSRGLGHAEQLEGTWRHGVPYGNGETPISGKTHQISSSDGEEITGNKVILGETVPGLNH